MLVIRDAGVAYGPRRVIDGVDLTARAGSISLLLGRSGTGKSSLLNAIVGLGRFSGWIAIGPSGAPPGSRVARSLLGFVPQEIRLYETLTALENVTFFGRQYGLARSLARQRAERLLAEIGLEPLRAARLDRLSGGERKRVSLACALVHEPPLLVLDEPTAGLDYANRRILWGLLQERARHHGLAVLATSHVLDDAEFADRIAVLRNGRLVLEGAPRGLVRELPGGGRVVVAEFGRLPSDDRRRLGTTFPELRATGGLEGAQYSMFSARYLARSPDSAVVGVAGQLKRSGFDVRSVRVEPADLSDVLVHRTGDPWEGVPS